MRWSEPRTAIRSTFEMIFGLPLRATRDYRPPSLILFSLDGEARESHVTRHSVADFGPVSAIPADDCLRPSDAWPGAAHCTVAMDFRRSGHLLWTTFCQHYAYTPHDAGCN